jgi:hypothetical protein
MVGAGLRHRIILGRVSVALAISLTVLAAAIAIVLLQAPITVAGINTAEQAFLGTIHRSAEVCQRNEALPRDTSAIRLRIFTQIGPRVTVEVLSHGRVLTSGEQRSGWTGGVVTVPVRPLSRSMSGVQLCSSFLLNGNETASIVGSPAARIVTASGHVVVSPARVRVEYLRPGRSSWWSLALVVARHMGLGHAGSGTWSVLLVLLLMAGVVLLCSRTMLRQLR